MISAGTDAGVARTTRHVLLTENHLTVPPLRGTVERVDPANQGRTPRAGPPQCKEFGRKRDPELPKTEGEQWASSAGRGLV